MKNTAVSVYLCMMLCATAHASDVRCLPFDNRLEGITSCTTTEQIEPFEIEWRQNCTYSGENVEPYRYPFETGVYVSGIAQCGRDTNMGTADVTEFLELGAYDSVFCYCKLTYPFVSQWVAVSFEGLDGTECRRTCAMDCANVFAADAGFRANMIQNLSRAYETDFDNIAYGIAPAEDIEFFGLTGDEWRTRRDEYQGDGSGPEMDIIEPNRCPYGSSVFALRHFTLERMCDPDGNGSKITVDKRRTCLETEVYEEAGYTSSQVRQEYFPISECSMYIPDHHYVYGMEHGLIGIEGNSRNNPEETFYYYSVCGLSEG